MLRINKKNIFYHYLQGFDPHSAFFTKVVNKKKKAGSMSETQIVKPKKDKGDKSDEEVSSLKALNKVTSLQKILTFRKPKMIYQIVQKMAEVGFTVL